MKKLVLSVFVLMTISFAGYSQVMHWPLDDNANDIIGGKNGIPTDQGVSFISDPQRGKVMLLDGVEGFVTLPSNMLTGMNHGTFTCWFNFSGGKVWQRVYAFGHIDVPWAMFYICPRNGWEGNNLFISMLAEGSDWQDYDLFPIDTLKWYFTAAVFDVDTFRFYLDDELVFSDYSLTRPSDIMCNPNEAYFGKSHWPADPTYNGMIDDMRIYDSPLTEAQILELFSAPVSSISSINKELEISIWGYNGRIYSKIDDESIIQQVCVYSTLGTMIHKSDQLKNLREVHFNPGIYIVNIICSDRTISKKVMISD